VDDAHEYLATRRAMDIVGISEEEQVSLPSSSKKWFVLLLHSEYL
jgi:hypothetical protein